jgi:hypothetical protein
MFERRKGEGNKGRRQQKAKATNSEGNKRREQQTAKATNGESNKRRGQRTAKRRWIVKWDADNMRPRAWGREVYHGE